MKTRDTRKKIDMKSSVADRIVHRLNRFAEALENNEAIQEKFSCRKIELDLKPHSYDSHKVRQIRNLLGLSQALFGRFLGVSVKTIQSWEQGFSRPTNIACRFMDEIRRNPQYWFKRLMEKAKAK